jgi:alpha-tubulin suppressor-like RCC1 family protein
MKNRRVSGHAGSASGTKSIVANLGRIEINSRDHAGLSVLHRAASSSSENAISFALALIEHPAIDIFLQDPESGWTVLHRALYFGNITIARAIIERDRREPNGPGNSSGTKVSIIKIKDHEGNSPFDVYNATIARRSLQQGKDSSNSEDGSDDSESIADALGNGQESVHLSLSGDELFVFGSNKNHSLGFGDGDDRQHPEKITLQRPDHLLFRFYREYLKSARGSNETPENVLSKSVPKSLADLPSLILNRPVVIHDVALSKLHSAIITTDPEANLYMCGFGPGGRLGTGDEVTRFTYTCIEEGGLAGKKIVTVALGQNHTLAVSSEGEIFSWGTSTYGQLGYSLPRPSLNDEEPISTTPRQIFGPLKREKIVGVAASVIHSVAHTSTSLFCWGKNEGQLGLMDSDSRSLAVQSVPRKVAASLFKAPITMVSAINGATICLLANHTVCVFTNYGYNMVKFPLDEEFSNYHLRGALTTRYDTASNHISSITAGGDTIAAVSSRGDLFTVGVRKIDSDGSTTNPSKIKSALSSPQKIWSLRKGQWDGIKSVGVAENGSVIFCTNAGAVWRRVKRAKIKDAFAHTAKFTRKDYKFQRVPGLTNVAAVRCTTFGVYAAIRKDCDVTRSQISVEKQQLWENLEPLLSIRDIEVGSSGEEETSKLPNYLDPLNRAVIVSLDVETTIANHLLAEDLEDYDVAVCTSTSEVGIPVHGFMLAARSSVLRLALAEFYHTGFSAIPEVLVIESVADPVTGFHPSVRITFQGLDFFSVLNLVIYLYTDTVVDLWNYTRHRPSMAFRYRQVRVEIMKLAFHLKMSRLEPAVRLMREPERQMSTDMDIALRDPAFFAKYDTLIELDGTNVSAHSALLCQRCPFFEGLFNGRSGGQWLTGRRESKSDVVRVDLKHIEPETFEFVMRYLYADVGTELFDDLVSSDLDAFSETVMDVMLVADELMLDRLSQTCQEVIGRFGENYRPLP